MNSLFLYMIESSICIFTFYILNRIFINKDSDFAVNRLLLLSFVIASLLIPAIKIPYFMQPAISVESTSTIKNVFALNDISFDSANTINQNNITIPNVSKSALMTDKSTHLSINNLILYFYVLGVLVSILLLLRNILSIWLILRNAKIKMIDGFRLFIVDKKIPSFTFFKSVVISKKDYNLHDSYILPHELAHIKLKHFYDLCIMQIVKIIFWFNPAIYLINNDLRQIHEFQADKHTLLSGVDTIQYQLLMIKKSVGQKHFAFANSFNQSQIKNRITMINNPKKQKRIGWKIFTFFTLVTLLVISFSSCIKVSTDAQVNAGNTEIKGSWKLIKYNYSGDSVLFLFPGTRIKYIGDNNFCWINIGSPNNKVTDTVGGTFKLDGENYTEYVEFVGSGMSFTADNKQKFTVKIENDKLYLDGVLSGGQKIKEVWERLTE